VDDLIYPTSIMVNELTSKDDYHIINMSISLKQGNVIHNLRTHNTNIKSFLILCIAGRGASCQIEREGRRAIAGNICGD
jgi:hypothetical protein